MRFGNSSAHTRHACARARAVRAARPSRVSECRVRVANGLSVAFQLREGSASAISVATASLREERWSARPRAGFLERRVYIARP
jgi:hypothetical protein